MPLFSGWTLQRKLVVLSLCVLLPLVLFGYYLVQENASQTKSQILSSSAATADIVAYQVDDFVESTEKLLQVLAKMEVARNELEHETRLLLMDAVVLNGDYPIIFATREDGTIFAAGVTRGMRDDNVASSVYIADAISRQKPEVSGRLPSRLNGEPVVNIVVPLKNGAGQVIGAMGAGVSLNNLQQRLTSDQIRSQKALVMLTDGNGTVLVHPDWQRVRQETWLGNLPPVQAGMRLGGRGTIEYVDPNDNKTYLAAYTRARSANWVVVVAYPGDLTFSPVQQAVLRGLVGLAVTAIVAALIGLFFTARFTHPISELSKKTRAEMGAIAGMQPQAKGRDEVQQLAIAIDMMSSNLSRHTDELARTRREIDEKVHQLRELSTKAVQVQEEERKRLALDVHDGMAQLIFGALSQTHAIEEHLASNPEAAARRLRSAEKLLNQAVVEVKRMMLELHPNRLEDGLVGAVQRNLVCLEEAFGIRCELCVVGACRSLSDEVEVAIFRIVQEAVNNARKHAEANLVEVTIRYEPSFVKFSVRDDGKGFDPQEVLSSPSKGLGLVGMSDRARWLGTTLEIWSAPGKGTTISMELPTDGGENSFLSALIDGRNVSV